MSSLRASLLPLFAALVLAAPAWAFVPQTIVVDGTNDFNVANLLDADGGDTQFTQLDQGNIYLTNDTNFLYFGFDYNHGTWCDVNLGLAIDKNTVAGGPTDAFSRKIAWNTVPKKPDFYLYDVIPTSCNSYNYEVLYAWSGAAWTVISDGPNGLGMADGPFTEGKVSLSTLGVGAGDTLHVEFWVTQDGTTKGPLDAMCSDAIQLSTPTSTTWDVSGAPIEMSCMMTYVVQGTSDTTPPLLQSAKATGFVVDGQKQISTSTTMIDVEFNEPVGVGAATPGNYSVQRGPATYTVTGAAIDGSNAAIVHLTLGSSATPSASFFDVTATNVKDLAGNTIVNDGVGNKKSFILKRLRFEGDMSVFMITHSSPPDSFFIEGSLVPLTFNPTKDNALMLDPDVDSIYVTTVPMSVSKSTLTGKAEATLEWKFLHDAVGFEPRSNRQFLVTSDTGSSDTLRAFWNDDNPAAVIQHPIDVFFRVNAALFGPGPLDTVGVTGDQAPLPSFATPGILMADDGVAPDLTAGDGIYAVKVRFPVGTYKTVYYKYTFNSAYECLGQSNRDVYLNDAAFDTVGGALGPIELPARGIDRCSVTDKAVKVIFRVDTDYWFGAPITSVGVNGSRLPLDFSVPSLTALLDDGVAPDATASDHTYTVAVIFPDSTGLSLGYKYLINDTYECVGDPDRSVYLDDLVYSVANPLMPPVGIWNYCTDITTGVPGDTPKPAVTIHLAQNYPNPFSPRTTIEFRSAQAGRAVLEIFDVTGRRVRGLLDRNVDEGMQVVQWDGRDDGGRTATPGIYFYSLSVDGQKATRRMLLLP
jgi:hypothetical protein